MKFRISGTMKIGRQNRKFEKEIEAATEKYAVEKAYMLIGSANGIPRSKIKVEEAKKVE
jgi:ribosomal protein L20A (L18A)